MYWDYIWGNTSFKFTVSIALGFFFYNFIPPAWFPEIHSMFGYRIFRYLPFLLGFPITFVLEQIYMGIRKKHIKKLINYENYSEATIIIDYIGEVNPYFFEKLKESIMKDLET